MRRYKCREDCCKRCCLPFPPNSKKRLYLDFAVSGGGSCGQLSFSGMPLGGTYRGAIDGVNTLNCGNDGVSEYIGAGHAPYPIDADCWIASACNGVIDSHGCAHPPGDCWWGLGFQIGCELNPEPFLGGPPYTGRYLLIFDYFFADLCQFVFDGDVKPTSVRHCWKRHGKVDMTFSAKVYSPVLDNCHWICSDTGPRTFTFRIYSR